MASAQAVRGPLIVPDLGLSDRIATNACLGTLRRSPRRVTVPETEEPVTVNSDWSDPPSEPPPAPEGVRWVGPYPDRLLEPAASRQDEPEQLAVALETIELTYMAAIQHLPPRQRAVLILCHTLGWSGEGGRRGAEYERPLGQQRTAASA